MPSEMTHDQWVERTRKLERQNKKNYYLLLNLRAVLVTQLGRLDHALSNTTLKNHHEEDN
jgi:hypothetical protein